MKKSTGYLIAGILALAVLARRPGAHMESGAALSSDVEYGFTVFEKDGQFIRGMDAWGTRYGVTVPAEAPPGYRPLAIYHTHPPEALHEPSEADLEAARQWGVPAVCIERNGEVKCWLV